MKRALAPAVLAVSIATFGVVHPNFASASTGVGDVRPNVIPTVSAEISSESAYCTDGTTTCDSSPYTNFNTFRSGFIFVAFYGHDPTRGLPFSLSGNTPDYLFAECEQGYIATNGDRHVITLETHIGPAAGGGDSGTITGKAVILPTDTYLSTFAYAGMNVAGTDTALATTVNYAKGNQYTNNTTQTIVGGTGFELGLTGTGTDSDKTTDSQIQWTGSLTCTVGLRNALSQEGYSEVIL